MEHEAEARGLAPRILPSVSLVLASWRRDYMHGLTGTQYEGAPDGAAASAGLNRWIALFAGACRRAAGGAVLLVQLELARLEGISRR